MPASSTSLAKQTSIPRKQAWADTGTSDAEETGSLAFPFHFVNQDNKSVLFTLRHMNSLRESLQALAKLSLTKLCSVFSEHAYEEKLTPIELRKCLVDLIDSSHSEEDTKHIAFAFQRIFDIYDRNGESWVWCWEFVCTVSCLVDKMFDAKIEALFLLFNQKNSSNLSVLEFTEYTRHLLLGSFAVSGMLHSYNSRILLHSICDVAANEAGPACASICTKGAPAGSLVLR